MKKKWSDNIMIYLLPLLFIGSLVTFKGFLDIVVTAKTLFFYFTVCLMAIGFSFSILSKENRISILKLNYTDVLVGIYFVFIIVRLLFTPHISPSAYSFVNFIMLMAIYVPVRWVSGSNKNPGTNKLFHYILTSVVIIQFIFGLIQYLGIRESLNTNFRISGFFNNPGIFSIYIAGILPYLINNLLNKSRKTFDRIFSIFGILASVLILVFSNSRTSWIATIVGLIYFVIVYMNVFQNIFRNSSKMFKNILPPLIISITIIVMGLSMYGYKKNSSDGRLFVWKISKEMIMDKPLFGFGFDRYQAEHNEYQANYFKSNLKDRKNGQLAANDPFAFNDYVQITVEYGIVGLLIFMGIFVSLFYKDFKEINSAKEDSNIAIGAKTSLVVLLTASLFSYPLQDISSSILFFLGAGLVSGNNREVVFSKNISKSSNVIAFFILVFSIFIIRYTMVQFKAQMKWKKAVVLNMSGQTREAFSIYRNIFPKLKHDRFFLYNYGSELVNVGDYANGLEHLESAKSMINDADVYCQLGNGYEKSDNLEEAIAHFEKASYLIPHRFYPKYRLVPLYYLNGNKNEAISMAFNILEMDVKVESEEVDKMKNETKEFLDNIIGKVED